MGSGAVDLSAAPAIPADDPGPPGFCVQCGAPIVRRRRTAHQNPALCGPCDQRARRAAYFRAYYEAHRDRILTKNRKWARDNREKLVQLRQARQARQARLGQAPRRCADCGAPVVRAARCRRCYIRYRYATDSEYRARRLATTRRWLARRQQAARSGTSARLVQPIGEHAQNGAASGLLQGRTGTAGRSRPNGDGAGFPNGSRGASGHGGDNTPAVERVSTP